MKRFFLLAGLFCAPALAQERRQAPLSDTEDASLGFMDVSESRLHLVLGVDLRNGDFARGNYDDDAAGLERLPLHAQVGLIYALDRDGGGDTKTWLMLRSSNGFHAPARNESTTPRAWYESNNLIGLASRLGPALTGALTYTVKASPNGISDSAHEVSMAFSMDSDLGVGGLKPGFAVTWRPRGGGGVYTQATIEPGWTLGAAAGAPRLSIPAMLGIGWDGFYQTGSGHRMFGGAGFALEAPLAIGGSRWTARAELLVLVRDDRLRALGGKDADPGAILPSATLSLSYAY